MPEAPETDRAKLREALGLSDPLPTQFVRFVTNAARGDFGQSFFHREPAFKLVTERMPTTLALTCLAVMLALAVALPVGIYSAVRRNTLMDHAATVIVFLGQSMPVFWIGIMLMLLFAVQWRLLPVSGWGSWASMVLPAGTPGAFPTPLFLRVIRSSILGGINLDYRRTARGQGGSGRLVVCRPPVAQSGRPA